MDARLADRGGYGDPGAGVAEIGSRCLGETEQAAVEPAGPLQIRCLDRHVEQASDNAGHDCDCNPCIQFAGFKCAKRSEEHTSELQSLMRNSYAVFCLKKKNKRENHNKKNEKQNQSQADHSNIQKTE